MPPLRCAQVCATAYATAYAPECTAYATACSAPLRLPLRLGRARRRCAYCRAVTRAAAMGCMLTYADVCSDARGSDGVHTRARCSGAVRRARDAHAGGLCRSLSAPRNGQGSSAARPVRASYRIYCRICAYIHSLVYIHTHIGRFSYIYTHTHRSVLAQLSYIYTYAYTLACTYTYAYTRRSVPAVNTPEWGARWGSRVLETCDKRMAPLIAARLQVLNLLALLVQ